MLFGSQSELRSEARGDLLALSPTWVQSSPVVPAPGRSCASTEMIADAYQRRFGREGRCDYGRLWLRRIDRTFSAGQWHPSGGGDAGCDSIWGSWAVTVGGEVPLNLGLLTSHWINTKKNHNLDTSLCDPKKTESQKCFACCDSFLGGIYKCNLYCAVKSRKLKSLSRLWSFGGNFILPWQHAYEDF